MLVLNPQKLVRRLQSQAPVFDTVFDSGNDLANRLIKNLQIQSGFGLAGFLNVDGHLDNFMAVRVWVNQQLTRLYDDTVTAEVLYNEIEHRFYACVPELG